MPNSFPFWSIVHPCFGNFIVQVVATLDGVPVLGSSFSCTVMPLKPAVVSVINESSSLSIAAGDIAR